MSRRILATLRAPGNIGDQLDSTDVEATAHNLQGISQALTLAIPNQALGDCGFGAQFMDALEIFARAVVTLDAGATLSAVRIVWRSNAVEESTTILGTGEWETSGELRKDPSISAWTGTKIDGVTVRIEADVVLPPNAIGTLSVREIRAEVLSLAAFDVAARGGTLYAQAAA